MSRIYLASSWKNPHHSQYVSMLRNWGNQVYDFTARGSTLSPGTQECRGFAWKDIGAPERLSAWTFPDFRRALTSEPKAAAGYLSDLRHMEWADTCVCLLPCGRSAHLEAGYMKGRGKRVIIHTPNELTFNDPELMYLLADHMTIGDHELKEVLHS